MSALCLLGPRDEPVTGGQWSPHPFRKTAAVSTRLDPPAAQPVLVKADTDTHSRTHWVSPAPQQQRWSINSWRHEPAASHQAATLAGPANSRFPPSREGGGSESGALRRSWLHTFLVEFARGLRQKQDDMIWAADTSLLSSGLCVVSSSGQTEAQPLIDSAPPTTSGDPPLANGHGAAL